MLVAIKEKLLRHWRAETLVIVLVVLGVVAGSLGTQLFLHYQDTAMRKKYSFLSRRILTEKKSDVLLNFRPLQNDYQEYLNANNLNDKVNLYFEYLPTGSSIGINEDKESTGASLLKLPLVVSFYKLVESGELSLDTTVSLKKEWLNSSFGTLYEKGEGYKLTYREAIKYALQDSDNTAALALFDAVSKSEHTNTPTILGFVDANYANTPQQEVAISTQSYGSILKCLYFSCYLTKDDSQAILSDLAHSEADDRLALYLPSNTKIAHKIGTFGGENQSDCGIVYVPKRHFLLCVMVQGKDPEASRIIGDLSQMTYKFLDPSSRSAPDQ